MIYLLHGGDQTRSRQELVRIKSTVAAGAVSLLYDSSLAAFVEACESRVFFSENHLVVVESDPRAEFGSKLLEYLEHLPPKTDVVFWFPSKLRKSHPLLKKVARLGRVRCFELPVKKPFSFLDRLGERDAGGAFLELDKLLNAKQSELFIVQMIAWKVKSLLRARAASGSTGQSYTYRRSKEQSRNFSEQELVEIYGRILQSDLEMKSGGDPRLVLSNLICDIVEKG